MLRQLAALTRRVPAAGPRALAVAVYSGPDGELIRAQEQGDEGVACVDDAARATVLLCRLWQATGNPALGDWAAGLLDFLLWMRAGDGRWVNFIRDWEGTRNNDGVTSAPGVNFWQARATYALAETASLMPDPAAEEALAEALAAAAEARCPPDVRALHSLAATRLLHAGGDSWLAARVEEWCAEMVDCAAGDVLLNFAGEHGTPHLWGHVQEAALSEAAGVLGRHDLQEAAVRSAEALFVPAIESGFDSAHVQPYDVQSAAFVMDHLAAATGDRNFGRLAQAARAWFDGRNPAGAPTYDRARGRVADGVDDGRVNSHSGAEANISAGLALAGDTEVLDLARAWTGLGLLDPRPALPAECRSA